MYVFLSCTATKATQPCAAKDMYISSFFKKSLAYARTKVKDSDIYILSAKHGLLNLNDNIKPYSKTLVDMSIDSRKAWAHKVLQQMKDHNISFNKKALFLTGEKYNEFVAGFFKDSETPYQGKTIGYILQWLDKQPGVNENYEDHKCSPLYEYLVNIDDIFE